MTLNLVEHFGWKPLIHDHESRLRVVETLRQIGLPTALASEIGSYWTDDKLFETLDASIRKIAAPLIRGVGRPLSIDGLISRFGVRDRGSVLFIEKDHGRTMVVIADRREVRSIRELRDDDLFKKAEPFSWWFEGFEMDTYGTYWATPAQN
jgi:hypothetical protein